MPKDKLTTLRRLARDAERDRAIALEKARQERRNQESQAQSLQEMLTQYRQEQISKNGQAVSSRQLAIFQRFYGRVSNTLIGHGQHVEQLREREQDSERRWHAAYRQHKAITRLQENREREQKRLTLRKERRSSIFRRWTMLNTTDKEQGN